MLVQPAHNLRLIGGVIEDERCQPRRPFVEHDADSGEREIDDIGQQQEGNAAAGIDESLGSGVGGERREKERSEEQRQDHSDVAKPDGVAEPGGEFRRFLPDDIRPEGHAARRPASAARRAARR